MAPNIITPVSLIVGGKINSKVRVRLITCGPLLVIKNLRKNNVCAIDWWKGNHIFLPHVMFLFSTYINHTFFSKCLCSLKRYKLLQKREVYEIENMLEVLKHMKHFCSTQTKILQKITYKYALYWFVNAVFVI
jgi:hypothetical protein